MATLVLRGDNLSKYRRLAGLETDASLARRIGVDPTTVYRVLNGRTTPSARFIAGIVDAFGADLFPDLFEVVPDELASDSTPNANRARPVQQHRGGPLMIPALTSPGRNTHG